MNKSSGTMLVVLIMFSLLASGGAKQGTSGGPSALPNHNGGAHSKTDTWTVPPDPRCFLIETIRDFYGSPNPAEPIANENTLPTGPYYDAYRFDQYGCSPGEVATKNTWGIPTETTRQIPPIRFVIATVPDPVRSHLSLFFDRSMDAIQQAAQAAGYSFSRAGMPWDPVQHETASDLAGKLAWDNFEQEQEKLPGLMIFRKNVGSQKIEDSEDLFVFVVGETPTGGIHKEQFDSALQIKEDIQAVNPKNTIPPVGLSIMGPTFSGSLFSLNDILTTSKLLQCPNEANKNCPIYVHSGTVTSKTLVDQFTESQGTAKFMTFQESDGYAECSFFQYAREQKYDSSEIAELSEDETAFGNPSLSSGSTNNDTDDNCEKDSKNIIHLYFPREISQLRAAYQNELQKDLQTESGKQAPRTTLPLNLQDSRNDADSVPAYAQQQYPLSQESIMLTIANLLRFHHSKYVLLKASDPIDLLFLTRFLRRAYPQGRIVTLGADLLYRREVEDDLLHGIMAITPYSLMPGVDDWEAKPCCSGSSVAPYHVFPSSYSSGVYNAMLSLLPPLQFDSGNESDRQLCTLDVPSSEKCPLQLSAAPYTEFGWPAMGGASPPGGKSFLSPALWLTVLGRGSYWPVALLDTYEVKEGPKSVLPHIQAGVAANENREFYQLPQSWILLNTAMLILVALFMVLQWRGSLFSTSEIMAFFAPLADSKQTALLTLIVLLLLSAALAVMWPWWWWATYREHFVLLRITACFLALIVGLMLAWGVNRPYKNLHCPKARPFPLNLKTHIIVLIILAVVTVVLLLWCSNVPAKFNLFSFRYIHITSGVSCLPSILLLLAAGAWWAWHNLEGAALLDSRRPRLPSETKLDWNLYHTLTDEGNGKLLSALNALPCGWSIYALPGSILVVAVFAYFLFRSKHQVWGLEPWPFDLLYAIAVLIVGLFLALELARLIVSWLACRRLLRTLDRLFLRRAFCKLKGFSWKPIWALGGGPAHDSMRVLSREISALRYARNITKFDFLALDSVTKNIGDYLKNTIYKDRSGKVTRTPESNRTIMHGLQQMQNCLADACGDVFNSIQKKWQEETGPDLYDDTGLKSGKKDSDANNPDKAQVDCEQFVALVYVNFVVAVLLRLRTVVVTIAGLYVCLLLSLSVYPVEPKPILRPLLILSFFAIVAVVGWVYAQMHRDTILSRLTDTTPGELGMDFYVKMASFVVLPLVSLLVSQFPDINNFLFSWLQPALQALNH